MWAQVINMIIGLIVMAAPGFWNYTVEASNTNYIVGPLIVTFAMIAITDIGRNARLFNILMGVWLTVSPFFIINAGYPASLINMVSGIVIVVLSLVKGKLKHRFGGGWRSLLQKDPLHMQEANRRP